VPVGLFGFAIIINEISFFILPKNSFSFKENFSLIILILFFFTLGIYDDKFSIKPYTRLLLSFFSILILVFLNDNFNIKELRFSFLDYKISLGNLSILFTLLCILLFINACNMFDGINLQSPLEGIEQVTVYDFLGKRLYEGFENQLLTHKITQIQPNNQVLFVRVTLSNGSVVTKKVVY
jgi:uncharacterized membrane protein